MFEEPPLRPVIWVGTSRKDLRSFPEPVQDLSATPCIPPSARKTPQRDIEMVRRRLREAEQIARKKES